MASATVSAVVQEKDEGYDELEQLLRDRIAAVEGPVFTTDASPDELWRLYLEGLPADRRQHYNCRCCQRFVQQYGGLVDLDSEGNAYPVLWPAPVVGEVPEFFRNSLNSVRGLVEKAKVAGVYLWDQNGRQWGTPQAGGWSHLSGLIGFAPHSSKVQSPSQAAADKKQDYQMLCQALVDYPADLVSQALRVLEADALYRSEKAVGVAKWFAELHQTLSGLKGRNRQNLIWLAVATAPAGFCHLRSTMISTLLDDLKAGLSFEVVQKRWAAKMHPLQYQRPTAAPTEGAIKQAEKVFEQMGAASALKRRFARLEDLLSKLWVPVQAQVDKPEGGLFGHLKPKSAPVTVDLPEQAITFDKFRRTVLPEALAIEVRLNSTAAYYGLLTAADPTAPPVLQWDGLEGQARNPVNHYFYSNGSLPSQWSLSGEWAEVTAVFLSPAHWQAPERFTHQQQRVYFALKGAVDKATSTGLCLFPEVLRSEFHPVRSVIEANNRTQQPTGRLEATANGAAFDGSKSLVVRVRTAGGKAIYKLDRWD